LYSQSTKVILRDSGPELIEFSNRLTLFLTKHPALCNPVSVGDADGAFEPYPDLPAPIPVCITQDDVEAVSSRLSGAARPGGTDAVELSNWLLRFGRESKALREEMAAWTNWLANTSPPWAAYWALMANRLVALDKQPGTCPVGIGEVYRQLWAKCLLKAIGAQATAACGCWRFYLFIEDSIEKILRLVFSYSGKKPKDHFFLFESSTTIRLVKIVS
jgi:hypothetical protein